MRTWSFVVAVAGGVGLLYLRERYLAHMPGGVFASWPLAIAAMIAWFFLVDYILLPR